MEHFENNFDPLHHKIQYMMYSGDIFGSKPPRILDLTDWNAKIKSFNSYQTLGARRKNNKPYPVTPQGQSKLFRHSVLRKNIKFSWSISHSPHDGMSAMILDCERR
jgi:hypothetical protein